MKRKNGKDDSAVAAAYLRRALASNVYDVAIETPVDRAAALSGRTGCEMLLKREDLQPVHSFKLRGAYCKMSSLPKSALAAGVLAASAGNHAQGVALAAKRLGCEATIVMPVTTPDIKVAAVRALGAKIVLSGDSYSDCAVEAKRIEKESGLLFIPPYDDPDVIAGQGTVALEIMRQCRGPVDAIFVPVGGGGLAAGVAAVAKAIRPDVKVFGVEPDDSDCMRRSLRAGRRVELAEVGLFADGVAVKKPGKITFDLCRRFLDGIVLVGTDETCAAIKDGFEATRAVFEPAGALAVAAAKKYAARPSRRRRETYVCVVSGANMNFDRIRFVSEQTETGEGREAVFDCAIPEEPGAFKRFIAMLGRRNVTEFNYRRAGAGDAHVFVGLAVDGPKESAALAAALRAKGVPTVDLSGDPVAKEHIRFMVGGCARGLRHERVFAFRFPERPGALRDFLEKTGGRWDITLFHYRSHGSDQGRVLCGFLVPPAESAAFARVLDEIGYLHREVTSDPAYRHFLGRDG